MSPLPTATITVLDVNPDYPISVQDFLRGLKKPAPTSTASRKAPEALRQTIPLQGTLSANQHRIASVSTAPVRLFESSHHEVANEPSPTPALFPAMDENLSGNEALASYSQPSMKEVKVFRTYCRRVKPSSLHSFRDASPLFSSQGSTSGSEKLDVQLETEEDTVTIRKGRKAVGSITENLTLPEKSTRRRLRNSGERRSKLSGERRSKEKGTVKGKDKKKKRRAPVHELALVGGSTFDEDRITNSAV